MQEELPIWAIRVEGVKDAQRRSRSVFAIITVVSIALLISTWNSYLSWYRLYTKSQLALPSATSPSGSIQDEMTRSLILDWSESRRVTVPLLGVSIGNSDGLLLGTFSLLVLSLWFYMILRKENNLIGDLIRDAHVQSGEHADRIRRFVYHGIVSQLVFISLDQEERQILSLTETDTPRSLMHHILGFLTFCLFLLPFLTALFLLVMDTYSLFTPSLFRPGGKLLIQYLGFWDFVHLAFVYGVAIPSLFIIFSLNKNVLTFKYGTTRILDDFDKILKKQSPPETPDQESGGKG